MTSVIRGVCAGAVLAALCATGACSKDPDTQKRHLVESGDAYAAKKQVKEAIVEYRHAVQIDPKYAEARLKLGNAYEQIGDLQDAFRELVRAADLMPENTELQLKVASYLLMSGQFADAETRADAVLQRDSHNAKAQIVRGSALAGLKDFDKALDQLQQAADNDPDGWANISLGNLQTIRGNRLEAETAFKKAVELAPKAAAPHLALANYYWSAGNLPETEQELKAANSLEPKSSLTNRSLSFFYIAVNRRAEAEPYFKRLVEANPQNVNVRLGLADYYLLLGKLDKASAIWEEVAKEQEGFRPAKMRLARVAKAQGNIKEADRLLDEVLKRDAADPAALTVKAQMRFSEGKTDEALAKATAAVQDDANSVEAQYTLGLIQTSRRAFDAAFAAFQAAVKVNPQFVPALVQLARLELDKRDLPQAADFARRAIQAQPQATEPHLILAQAEMFQGHLPQAAAELDGLLKTQSGVASVHIAQGELLRYKGDKKGAMAEFERGLQLEPANVAAVAGIVALQVEAKNPQAALATLQPQLAKNPKNAKLQMIASQVYLLLHDSDGVEKSLLAVIDADPASLAGYTLLVNYYATNGKVADGERLVERGLQQQPKSVPLQTMAGMLAQMQGKTADAQKRYEQALAIDGNAAVAANNLAWIYAENGGNLDVALKLAQTARQHIPKEAAISDTLGWIYYKKDLASLAVPMFEDSAKQEPDNPTFQYHLGLAYVKIGDMDKARTALQRAVKTGGDSSDGRDARKALAALG
jgi:tetratricopeptide (TPR) repeat protein